MTKNPIINAVAALVYIAVVVLVISNAQHFTGQKDSIFAPILFLSLLTLSASFMAFNFFYQPFQLYFNNKKKQAVDLVAKTIATFAVLTLILLVLVFTKILH